MLKAILAVLNERARRKKRGG